MVTLRPAVLGDRLVLWRWRNDPETRQALVSYLTSELDRAAAAAPNPGRPMIRRLNRVEYSNAIRDLLSLDIRRGFNLFFFAPALREVKVADRPERSVRDGAHGDRFGHGRCEPGSDENMG